MGAVVTGAGTPTITVKPASSLDGVHWAVLPDRIEAGTYLAAAAITSSRLTVSPCIPEHLEPVTALLQELGCQLHMCVRLWC
jgi:UDP-N-acetylglucosamine 1-carboxyvinyltransferase